MKNNNTEMTNLKQEISSMINQMQMLGIDADEIESQFTNSLSKCQGLINLYNSNHIERIQLKLSNIGVSHKKRQDGIYFLSRNKYYYFYFQIGSQNCYSFCVEDHMERVLREFKIEKQVGKKQFSEWLSKCIEVYFDFESLDAQMFDLHKRYF